MRNFLARSVVAVIGISLTVASIFKGDHDFFFAVVAITVVMMTNEYCDMARESEYLKWSSIITVVATYWAFYAGILDGYGVPIIGLAGAVIFFLGAELLSRKFWIRPENPVRLILYLGLLPSFLPAMRAIHGDVIVLGCETGIGSMLVLDYLCAIWAMDTFAYLIGRKLKTAQLCPDISPGKTVGGAIAGFVAAVIAATLFAILFHKPTLILLGPVVGSVGQVGDLAESFFKRNLKMKDSGNSLPGHGGFMDRLDSTIFAAPIAYLLFRLIGY